MATTTETGHNKNVVNFETITTKCNNMGALFNPSNEEIALPALKTTLQSGKEILVSYNKAKVAFDNVTNERKVLYQPVSSLITRVIAAVKSAKISKESLDDLKSLADLFRGHRKAPSKAQKAKAAEGEEVPKSASRSKQSYDSKAESFEKLVSLLETTPSYKPNEQELSLAVLKTLSQQLKDANTRTADAEDKLEKARNERNRVLYGTESGLVDLGGKVKQYALSLLSTKSPEYKQLIKIKLKDLS